MVMTTAIIDDDDVDDICCAHCVWQTNLFCSSAEAEVWLPFDDFYNANIHNFRIQIFVFFSYLFRQLLGLFSACCLSNGTHWHLFTHSLVHITYICILYIDLTINIKIY